MQTYLKRREALTSGILPYIILIQAWVSVRKKHPAISLFLAGVCTILTGCAGAMNDTGGKYVHDQWLADVRTGRISEVPNDLNAAATPAFVFRMKAVKDYEFGNYVRNLRRATSWGEFASDSVKIILDSLVAVTGGVGTKAALGAASAGVTGATTSIKKNVLFDQSITTFITKMDGLRLAKWNDILCKLGRCPGTPRLASYTVAEAFADLEEYGRCGSLDAALRGIDAKANEEKTKEEKKAEHAKTSDS
ncbi:MAG: hypothetical protein V7609_2342 [Verrucomicrobiota bacterium]